MAVVSESMTPFPLMVETPISPKAQTNKAQIFQILDGLRRAQIFLDIYVNMFEYMFYVKDDYIDVGR